jgi:hypothetical protein
METEDFEFQPLTEGLGFYSRAERLKREAQSTRSVPHSLPVAPDPLLDEPAPKGPGPAEASLKELMSRLPPIMDFDEPAPTPAVNPEPPKIYQALPRENFRSPEVKREVKSTTFESPALRAPVRKEMAESLRKAFPQTEPIVGKAQKQIEEPSLSSWVPTPTGILAAAIDFMTVLVLGFFCVVSLMEFADINLVRLIQDPRTSLLASVQLGIVVVGLSFIYQLATRSLIGHTLGDWATDVRLGTPQQQSSWFYPVAVLWRHLVFWATGVVVLPLLSLMVRRDLGKYLTGVSLYRRKLE